MQQVTHVVTQKGIKYSYDAMRSAIKINGVYKSFMRTYGLKRTREDAVKLVDAWERKNPLKYKVRDNL